MTFDVAQALLQSGGSRRKKRYFLYLYSSARANAADVKALSKAVAAGLPEFTLIRLEDPDEALKVLLLKNVEIAFIDHSFFGDDQMAVEYALEVKKRKKVPLLFSTRHENKLIQHYRTLMSLYEEMDDFVNSPIDFVEMTRMFRKAAVIEGRAAKRFVIGERIDLHRLDTDSTCTAELVDMSLVGFGVLVKQEPLLTRGEQVRIHVPLPPFGLFHPQYGEVLKLAGRVRRMSIDGHRLGCSLEHVTAMQLDCLTRLLELVVRKNRLARLQVQKPAKEAS